MLDGYEKVQSYHFNNLFLVYIYLDCLKRYSSDRTVFQGGVYNTLNTSAWGLQTITAWSYTFLNHKIDLSIYLFTEQTKCLTFMSGRYSFAAKI